MRKGRIVQRSAGRMRIAGTLNSLASTILSILHKGNLGRMMMDRILKMLKFDNLFDKLTGYLESRVEIIKFEIKEDLVGLLSRIVVASLISVCLVFALLLFSLGLANYLGSMVGPTQGLAIVGGFYILVLLALLIFHKEISAFVYRIMLKMAQQSNAKKNEIIGKK